MAVSSILPRHTMKNRSRKQSMSEQNAYDQKGEKTRDGELVSGYMCSPETAAEEFELSKRLYVKLTGREQPAVKDIIMYGVIQSFKPGEVAPEEAHKIGYELAMRITGGRHQFVVATHTDKKHIHTHIEFNSTNLDCNGKFRNPKNSYLWVRRLSDALCKEHGLSVIKDPKGRAKTQTELAAARYGRSHKEILRQTIDRVLPESTDYEDFLERMRNEGYEIKIGKELSFRVPEWDRFVRSYRLGEEYSKEALMDRANRPQERPDEYPERSDERTECPEAQEDQRPDAPDAQAEHRPVRDKAPARKPERGQKVNSSTNIQSLIDIRLKMAQGKGAGYERWAKIFNLKEAAKTLNFLVENGLTNYDELSARAEQAGERFSEASRKIKRLEGKMAEIAQLKTHIIHYAKTKDVYVAYQKSRNKNAFREEHADEIAQHLAAKEAFNDLGGKPIPKVAQLSKEYAALLEEKKACYEQYKAARQEMIDYRTMKQNVDRLLGLDVQTQQEQQRKSQQER